MATGARFPGALVPKITQYTKPINPNTMEITLQEYCELQLFMIAHNYSAQEIKAELSKYTVIK